MPNDSKEVQDSVAASCASDGSVASHEIAHHEIRGICSGEALRLMGQGVEVECIQPGRVIVVSPDGSSKNLSVFEVAIDPATAGEREFAVFECLRRSALARCQQRES